MDTESEPCVLLSVEGPVAVLTLNRPTQRNPITDAGMVDSLVRELAAANADPAIRAVILAAEGPAFSAGGDIKAMAKALEQRRSAPWRTPAYLREGIQRIPMAFEQMEVPTIAAVGGPAVGAGCDLACLCDLRIASERATFAESFVKMGLVAGDGGAWLLQRAVGFQMACEMAFTGDPIDAQEALRIGLVLKVVPHEELMKQARELALRIARNPRDAVRMTKRLMIQAREQNLAAALESARLHQALAQATDEHRDAVLAFLERARR
jgi:enoyl-CoA hydratase/carnithine racemase